MLVVEVSDRALAEAAGTLFEAQRFQLMPSPGVQDARLSALLQALHAEQVSGYGSGRLFVDGIEQALAACLVSRYSTHRPKRRVRTGGLSPSRAKRLVDHIQAHIGSSLPLDVNLLACAGFKFVVSIPSFSGNVLSDTTRFRARHAHQGVAELLAQPGNSILDVAQLCGFQTQQHFSRIFRQRGWSIAGAILAANYSALDLAGDFQTLLVRNALGAFESLLAHVSQTCSEAIVIE